MHSHTLIPLRPLFAGALATLAILLPLQPSAHAQSSINLVGTDGINTSSFNSGLNWSGGNAAAPGNDYFTNGFALRTPTAAGDYTFQGDSLTLNGGMLIFKTDGIITVNNFISTGGTLFHGSTATVSNNIITLAGNFELQSGVTTVNASASPRQLILNSTISGSNPAAQLNFTSSGGTVTINGNNSFQGTVDLNSTGGTNRLILNHSNALGNASLVTVRNTGGAVSGTGTRLDLQGGITVDRDLTLQSSADNRRVALYNVGGSNTWSGDITLDGPSITQLWSQAGTLTIDGNITALPTLADDAFFIRGNGNGVINGAIDLGTKTLAKTDGGTWQINSTGNTWGDTWLAAGTLRLGAHDALSTSAGVRLGQSGTSIGTLNLNGFNQTIASLSHASGSTNTTGQVVTNTAASMATLTINQAINTVYNGQINGNINLVKDGGGILRLRGNKNYTGETIVQGGTLFLGGDGTPSAARQLPVGTVVTVDTGATLRINGLGGSTVNNEIIGGLQGGGLINTTNLGTIARLTINNTGDYDFAGSFNAGQQLRLIKDGDGTQTFSGNSSFTGDATVEGGTWNITGSINRTGAANPVLVLPGGTLSGSGSITSNVNISGGTLAPGDSLILGLGTMNLNGDLSFASDWQVSLSGTDASLLMHDGAFNGSLNDITLTAGAIFNPATLTPLQIYQGTATLSGLFQNFSPGAAPSGLYGDADGYAEINGVLLAAYINTTLVDGDLIGGSGIVLFAIPEPSRALLLAAAGLGLLLRRRRTA